MDVRWISIVASNVVFDGFDNGPKNSHGLTHRLETPPFRIRRRLASCRWRFVLCTLSQHAPWMRVPVGVPKPERRHALRTGGSVQAASGDHAVVGCAAAAVMSDVLDILTERAMQHC